MNTENIDMSNQSNTNNSSGWGKPFLLGIMQILSLPMVLGIILVVYELNVPPERSIYNAIMRVAATGEATHIKTLANDQAKLEQLMALAVAEVERGNNAYAMYYQAIGQVMPILYTMESDLLKSQLATVQDSFGVTKFTANMGDLTSLVGMVLGDKQLQAAGSYSRQQRESMARQLKEITQNHRSTIPKDLIRDLPTPADWKLKTLEFKLLAEEIINGSQKSTK